MEKLRAGTEVLIKARVHRQTTEADQGIDAVVVWVKNPMTTTRSDRELSLTLDPADVVVPGALTPEAALLARILQADDFRGVPDIELTDDEAELLDRLAGLGQDDEQPAPADG